MLFRHPHGAAGKRPGSPQTLRTKDYALADCRARRRRQHFDDGYDDDVTTPTCSIVFKPLDGDAAEAEVSDVAPEGARCAKALFKHAQFADDSDDEEGKEPPRCDGAPAAAPPPATPGADGSPGGRASPAAASFYGSPHDVEDRGPTTDGASPPPPPPGGFSLFWTNQEHREEPPSPVRVDLRAPRDIADLDRLDDVDLPAQL